MKFLLKAFLLFALIVVGRLAKQPINHVEVANRKAIPASTASEAHSFFVQQVSNTSGNVHRVPGTPPPASTADVVSIE